MAAAAISEPPANQPSGVEADLLVKPHAAPGPRLVRLSAAPAVARQAGFLSDSLLENHHLENSRKSKLLDLFVVILLHVALIGGPILAGLYFTDTLNLQAYYKTMIVGPPPPPPPPPAPAVAAIKTPPKRVFINQGKLMAPTYIPQKVADIKEAPIEPGFGVEGGVPGGVPGGQMGGVIGGIVAANANLNAPLPPSSAGPKAPIRVGGKVRAPRGLYTPAPYYPVIARQTKIQGTVVIDAVLDESGRVIEARVVSGHPLLIQAALDTVKEWRYEPSYLNNQPISVALIVNVTFVLQQ
jgi:protein TonB